MCVPKPKPSMISFPCLLGSRKWHAFQPASNFQDLPMVGAAVADSLNGCMSTLPCVCHVWISPDAAHLPQETDSGLLWAWPAASLLTIQGRTLPRYTQEWGPWLVGYTNIQFYETSVSQNGCKPPSHSNDPEFWWSTCPLTLDICCQPLEVLSIWWLQTCTLGAKNLYFYHWWDWTSVYVCCGHTVPLLSLSVRSFVHF